MTERLTAERIGKTFPGTGGSASVAALGGVDLDLAAGEFVSIVGPSGCGKSTLLQILAGLIAPTSGRVLIDGRASARLLGSVGYMPQKDLLMPWRSVLDNAALALEVGGVSRGEARRRAREALPRFGLAGFEDTWPAQLSGGMRQRAALLRTFLGGREILLLDEPFGALDALTRTAMQGWLLEVWEQERKAILLVTHDVEEAIYLSDRVYVLSPRPGVVRGCVEIALPRPRTVAQTMTPAFLEHKARILGQLSEGAPGGTVAGEGR